LAVGVTVIVEEIGAAPAFVAVNPAIFPAPLAPKPIAVLELVHANVAPATLLVNAVVAIAAPAHTVMFAGTVTLGVGLTVMVYVTGVPGHPAAVGVTVIVEVIGVVPALAEVNAGVFPAPLAPSPIAVFEFVHANVVPATPLV
jgi:hypothetical protein